MPRDAALEDRRRRKAVPPFGCHRTPEPPPSSQKRLPHHPGRGIRALFFFLPQAKKKNPTLPYGRDPWGPSYEVGTLSGVSRSLPEGKHPTRAVFRHPL